MPCHPSDLSTLELTKYLWDEYQYRHGKCWEVVYKVGAAVIALEVAPYLKECLTLELGALMLAPTALGLLLAVFGFSFAQNELRIFHQSKDAYFDFRKTLVNEPSDPVKGNFDQYVYAFIGALAILSLVNCYAVCHVWIPFLQTHGCSKN